MSSPPADSSSPPGRLERIALRFTDFAERWLPDAFIFALLATIAVVE